MDAINQNKPKDISKIKQLLNEYENYKYPNKTDVTFPFSLNGKNLKISFLKPSLFNNNNLFQITGSRTSCTLSKYLVGAPLLM